MEARSSARWETTSAWSSIENAHQKAEETELGQSKMCTGQAEQRQRGDRLCARRWPQSARAFGGARPVSKEKRRSRSSVAGDSRCLRLCDASQEVAATRHVNHRFQCSQIFAFHILI